MLVKIHEGDSVSLFRYNIFSVSNEVSLQHLLQIVKCFVLDTAVLKNSYLTEVSPLPHYQSVVDDSEEETHISVPVNCSEQSSSSILAPHSNITST